MYPKIDNNTYYPPPPLLSLAPPVTTGFPVNSTNQFYPPPTNYAFQTQSQGPVPWSTATTSATAMILHSYFHQFQLIYRLLRYSLNYLTILSITAGYVTCFCHCITFGQIAEIIDRGSTSCGASGALCTLIFCLTGCQCMYSCFYRSKMRGQYLLHESPCNDCLVHCCCETCALCQEHRELQRRGFNTHIGWQANVEWQGRAGQPATMPPMVEESMSR